MKRSIRFLCLSGIFLCVSAQAGTIIKIQDSEGVTTVLTDGSQARLNSAASEYVIVDYASHAVRIVSPAKKQVLVLDSVGEGKGSPVRKVKTGLKPLGEGGTIAGYKTRKYQFTANGKSCGTIFASQDALRAPGIEPLFDAMQAMMEQQQAAMGGFAGMADDCTLGEVQMGKKLSDIGVPMRVEVNGRVESEVKSIQLNASLPADTFTIPASYKTMSMEEQMREASRQMQQYQPQMQEMMKQMQQMQGSGQSDDEGMTQMQIMQQMMRQQER